MQASLVNRISGQAAHRPGLIPSLSGMQSINLNTSSLDDAFHYYFQP